MSLTAVFALNRAVGVVLISVLFFGLGEQLWNPFLPAYLQAKLGAGHAMAGVSVATLIVRDLTEILARINRRGTTLLLVEQTLEVALALSHRLYVMDQGRIQFEGTPAALRQDPTIQQRFLEV